MAEDHRDEKKPLDRKKFTMSLESGDTTKKVAFNFNGKIHAIKLVLPALTNDSNDPSLLDMDGDAQWEDTGYADDTTHVIHFSDPEPCFRGYEFKLAFTDPGASKTVTGHVIYE